MDVRLFRPTVGEEELSNIKDVFERGWLGLGPNVSTFEEKFSNYMGFESSIGVNSCTAALHLAVSAFKFPAGKKVLVPVLTFAATAMAPIYNGLEPVFVDVDEKTLNISFEDLKRKYTEDCVAVMVVHFGGNPAEIDKIVEWANGKNLKVIEDCAHTIGGSYKGKKLGKWGDIGCFSFEEKKCMTTGDGGMICSDNKELIAPLKYSRWVGMDRDTWQRERNEHEIETQKWYYQILDLGYKYNMNDLSAAIGIAQLEKLDRLNQKRMGIIKKYMGALENLSSIKLGFNYDLNQETYWMFMIRVKNRNRFIKFMTEKSIATGVHYMPLTLHPFFKKYANETPIAFKIWEEFVTLPLHASLTDEEVDYVIEALKLYNEAE